MKYMRPSRYLRPEKVKPWVQTYKPTHRDQESVSFAPPGWGPDEIFVTVRSRNTPGTSYTVTCYRCFDWGIYRPELCTCPNGFVLKTKGTCYHRQLAQRILNARPKMALERARELAQGAKLAGISREEFFKELETLRLLHNDQYSAVVAYERQLEVDYGIVREKETQS